MPATKFPSLPLAFPVRGLHESVGFDIQPPGTATDAKNVRGYDVLKKRLRGGRRSGLSKYSTFQLGGGQPVQTLTKASHYITPEEPFGLMETADEDVSEDFTGFDDNSSTVDWKGRYIPLRPPTGTQTWTRDGSAFVGKSSTPDRAEFYGASNAEVGLGDTPGRILLVPFATNQLLEATFRAHTNTAANSAFNCSVPTVGIADAWGSTYVRAVMTRGATGLRVDVYLRGPTTGHAETLVVSSAEVVTASSNTQSDDLTLTIDGTNSGGDVIVTVDWPTHSLNFSVTASGVNPFAGIQGTLFFGWLKPGSSIANSTNVVTACLAASYTRKVPNSPDTFAETTIDPTEPAPSGSDEFFVPPATTAFSVTVQDGVTVPSYELKPGPFSSNPTEGNFPQIDDANFFFWSGGSNFSTPRIYAGIGPTAFLSTGRYMLDVRDPAPNGSTPAPTSFACRVSADFKSFVVVELRDYDINGNTQPFFMKSIVVAAVVNGVRTQLAAFTYTAASGNPATVVLPTQDESVRWYDDGTTVTLYVNGLAVFSYVPAGSGSWTPAMTAALVGYRIAALPAYTCQQVARYVPLDDTPEPPPAPRSDVLLAIAGGSLYNVATGVEVTGGDLIVTKAIGRPQAQAAYSKVFFVDGSGYHYYDIDLDAAFPWVATAGALPSGCRLAALYRGRMVLAGSLSDPHNWFMSKSGFPFNFDYSPAVTDGTEAVAGNNSEAGLVGDAITSLIPFGDDALLFGGDHTIWQMTGDPASGGSLDMISDQTGIAFGRPWAKDPDNTLYFFGTDGIYKFRLNQKPENITRDRLNRLGVDNVNLNSNTVFMAWDFKRHGLMVHIFNVNPLTVGRSYFYDVRNDAWWPDEYPVTMGPTCLLAFDGAKENDQDLLLGCKDGYVRKVDDAAADDDGIEITSFVNYAPFIAPDHASEVMLVALMPVFANGSGEVFVTVRAGSSAEDCALSDPRVRRVLQHGGRNARMTQRVAGYAVQVGVSHTGSTRWALEGLTASFDKSGMPRREVKNG